jgi:chromosome segregation ATPase
MKRQQDRDLLKVFQRLTNAADEFVNRAPRVKRIQTARSSLLDAITDAQLVLSVHRLPKEKDPEQAPAITPTRTLLEEHIKTSQATLHELEQRLQPLRVELEGLQSKVQTAKALLDKALTTPKFLERKKAA